MLNRISEFLANILTRLKRWLRIISLKNRNLKIDHTHLVDTYPPILKVGEIEGSPYFINFDPSPTKLQMFFGRRQELESIINHLHKGESILLIGEKRIGKTFLLYILGDIASRGAGFYKGLLDQETFKLISKYQIFLSSQKWIYIDLLGITEASGFYFTVLLKLIGESKASFKRATELLPLDHASFVDEINKISQKMSKRGQRAIILIDECEKLLTLEQGVNILSCLREVVQRCEAIDFLFTGDIKPHQDIPEFMSLKSTLRIVHLGPLCAEDAKDLIQIPVKGRIKYEGPAVDEMLKLTGRKPGLIQILCDNIFTLLVIENSNKSERLISLDRLNEMWNSGLRGKVFECFEGALRDFFESLENHDKTIFCYLAHHPLSIVQEISEGLGIQHILVQKSLHNLCITHRVEELDSHFSISAKIIEEFGTNFVVCPIPSSPKALHEITTRDLRGDLLIKTNLKHQADEVVELVKQWNGIKTQEEIEAWLLMFDDDERDIAIKLLNGTRYYSEKQINEYCTILHGKFERTIGHGLKPVWFLGLGGPSKSGSMLLYRYRMVNGVGESHFQDLRNLPSFLSKGIDTLAFVDDFIGTGQQVTSFWVEELEKVRGIERANLYCLVLFAFKSAIEYVHAHTPLKIISVDVFDERDRAFSPESKIFPVEQERKRAEEICRRHGELLYPEHPLGRNNSQALVAFDYQTPNNSLPILWSTSKGWRPIFERRS